MLFLFPLAVDSAKGKELSFCVPQVGSSNHQKERKVYLQMGLRPGAQIHLVLPWVLLLKEGVGYVALC